MHRLLKRQIRRYFADETAIPESMQPFLNAVSEAYSQADLDRQMLERSIDLMSQELLQANQQLRSAIPDLFLRLDWQGTIVDYLPGQATESEAYLQGINPIGTNLAEHLPPTLAIQIQQAMEQARAGRSSVAVEQTLDRNGQTYAFEARILGMFDWQAVMIVRDITDRKRAEATLRQSEQQLRDQSEQLQAALAALKSAQSQLIQQEKLSSLGQLVAGLAHEINNPLSFIVGNLRHLETYGRDWMGLLNQLQDCRPLLPPAVTEQWDMEDLDYSLQDFGACLRSIKTGANRIHQLVLALRTFSRLDEADCKVVDLHEGLDSALLLLCHRYAPANEDVVLERCYGRLPPVECYASQMNQVFLNLLSNAIDAVEERLAHRLAQDTYRGRIVITTAALPDHSYVEVRIRDNGPGIAAEIQARMFDPFFTTKPVGQGTGLGLSISHQVVVDIHRGSLTYRSEPGWGSEFTISISTKVTPNLSPNRDSERILAPRCSLPA